MRLNHSIKLLQHQSVINSVRNNLETVNDRLPHPPIHVRIEPTESCNFKCRFCWWHDSDRKKEILDTADLTGKRQLDQIRLKQLVEEFSAIGVRAISFTGAGDPLVYPSLHEIISLIRKHQIKVGVTSNLAMPLKNEAINQIAKMQWLRWSLNAGTTQGYSIVNQPTEAVPGTSFERAKNNLRHIIRLRDSLKTGLKVTASYVVTNENQNELTQAVEMVSAIGADAITFRPDTHYQRGISVIQLTDDFENRIQQLKTQYASEKLKISGGIERLEDNALIYDREMVCLYSNYSTYISASGDVYPCCYTRHDRKYAIGNINQQRFSEFWASEPRMDNYKRLQVTQCPSCPHVATNQYLRELKHILEASGNESHSRNHRNNISDPVLVDTDDFV